MDNHTQPNTPPPQPQTHIPTLPTTNRGNVFLFMILGLIMVAGGVFVGIQIGKKAHQQPTMEQQTLSPTQIPISPTTMPTESNPTINPTANWKTYINSDAKIVFKYPSSLSISDITQSNGIIIKIVGLEKEISLTIEPTTEHDFYTGKKVTDTFVLNNISWSYLTGDIEYCDGGECGSVSDALRTSNQGKRYTVVLGNLTYPEDVLNQILSTVKFTN